MILRNAFWESNQHIKMISKGSRNTDDWSDDCWKFTSAVIRVNIKIEKTDPKPLNGSMCIDMEI